MVLLFCLGLISFSDSSIQALTEKSTNSGTKSPEAHRQVGLSSAESNPMCQTMLQGNSVSSLQF